MIGSKGSGIQHNVTVELNGREYSGTYTVSSGIVTVHSIYGGTSTQAGASAAVTAKMLLREIVRGTRGRGEI